MAQYDTRDLARDIMHDMRDHLEEINTKAKFDKYVERYYLSWELSECEIGEVFQHMIAEGLQINESQPLATE